MSHSSDYQDEMFNGRYSERDIDLLFSGDIPNTELTDLAPVVEHLRTLTTEVDESGMKRFVAEATQAARAVPPPAAVSTVPPTVPRRRRPLVPRFAAVLAAMLLLIATTGLAAASNEAAPGDSLYGLDRVFERVGVGAGGAEERLAEATVLVNQGRAADALTHAVEVVGGDNEQVASDALIQAAERVEAISAENESATEVQTDVAAMLDWMSTTDATGMEFGQGVAERARQIGGGPPTSPSTASGNESNAGGQGKGPPDDVPRGPKGDAGD